MESKPNTASKTTMVITKIFKTLKELELGGSTGGSGRGSFFGRLLFFS